MDHRDGGMAMVRSLLSLYEALSCPFQPLQVSFLILPLYRSFLVQVPIVLIGLLNVCFVYPFSVDHRKESLSRKLKRVDFVGAVLIIAAVTCLLIGFDNGSNESWSSSTARGCILASVAFFAAFFYVEINVAVEPFAPASVLLDRTLAACLASGFFIYGAWFSILYYLPLFWQAVEGLSATQASVRLLPGVGTGVFGSLLAGVVRLIPNIAPKRR